MESLKNQPSIKEASRWEFREIRKELQSMGYIMDFGRNIKSLRSLYGESIPTEFSLAETTLEEIYARTSQTTIPKLIMCYKEEELLNVEITPEYVLCENKVYVFLKIEVRRSSVEFTEQEKTEWQKFSIPAVLENELAARKHTAFGYRMPNYDKGWYFLTELSKDIKSGDRTQFDIYIRAAEKALCMSFDHIRHHIHNRGEADRKDAKGHKLYFDGFEIEHTGEYPATNGKNEKGQEISPWVKEIIEKQTLPAIDAFAKTSFKRGY